MTVKFVLGVCGGNMKTEEKASSVVVHVLPKVGQKIYVSACWLSQITTIHCKILYHVVFFSSLVLDLCY
jgi:hypothetical protein